MKQNNNLAIGDVVYVCLIVFHFCPSATPATCCFQNAVIFKDLYSRTSNTNEDLAIVLTVNARGRCYFRSLIVCEKIIYD